MEGWVACIVGPYTGVNASLRLLENKFRNTAIGGKYPEDTEKDDERFSTYNIPISAIAASSAQNDSGLFELNFKDERYLPFEGAGVISKWRLELPSFKQFDYNTISDVILHVRYTATEGGGKLKKDATENVKAFMKSTEELAQNEGLFTIIDLKHDLPNEWHKATSSPGNNVIDLSKAEQFFPFYAKAKQTVKEVILVTDKKELGFKLNNKPFDPTLSISDPVASTADNPWQLTISDTAKTAGYMSLVMRFTLG